MKRRATRFVRRDEILTAMGFQSYRDYLASDLWATIRGKVFERDRKQCKICMRKEAYTAHHIVYRSDTMRGDNLDHLISICKRCHHSLEFTRDRKLTGTQEILDKTLKKLRRFGHTGCAKRLKKKIKCRCCGKSRKLGREEICLMCYKKYRDRVHDVARAVSAR